MKPKNILITALLALTAWCATAQTGTWKAYMSYYEPQQIVKADGNTLFVRASNGLYAYGLNDHAITTFDKVNTLSDANITHIAWNAEAHRLIIVYQNSNIDLMDTKGSITNISSLYTKSMTQDKTVNDVYVNGIYAYLATAFGVVKVNMQRAEIAESYILDKNISAVDISGAQIYVRQDNGTVLQATTTANLIDRHSWQTATETPANLFSRDTTDWDTYIAEVRTLKPGGPKHNFFGFMMLKDDVLYTSGCGYNALSEMQRPGTVQTLKDGEWTMLDDDMADIEKEQGRGWAFVDILSVDVDPFDSKHVFAAGRPGLFEYYDGHLVKYYNKDNSILQSATSSNKYVLIESVKYDDSGNLWLLQSQVKDNNIMVIPRGGEMTSLPHTELMDGKSSLGHMKALRIDKQGRLWFVNDYWGIPSVWCYDMQTDKIVNSFKTLVNQDGTTYATYRPRCLAEDFEGNIWIGTNIGPFLVDQQNLYTTDSYVTQVKVPRNDGSDYADYLLNGANVSEIAIDGGGRKWIATYGAGVYLISADNMEQIHNFTTMNSPLLSDNVESVVVNNKTGEVFFGTENGLCSYMGDATEASIEMKSDNVYAYPNPVVSGYNGLITVVGLALNSDVKVLTTNGQLVAEGRSNGGTFTWDGRDRNGRRVASGIYMVVAATSEGKKGAVCKIAIIQ